MSKALRIAVLCSLSVSLLAGPVLAGPSGRNGDPDFPQIANPKVPAEAAAASSSRGEVVVASERQLSDLWQRVIRLYVRVYGLHVR